MKDPAELWTDSDLFLAKTCVDLLRSFDLPFDVSSHRICSRRLMKLPRSTRS